MFTDPKNKEAKYLDYSDKIFLNNKCWNIDKISRNEINTKIDISAKFLGATTLIFLNDDIVHYDSKNSLGHKHQHIITNESSESKRGDNKIPPVIDTKFGLGSF